MVWMVELATKLGANVNAVFLWKLLHKGVLSRNSWDLQAKIFASTSCLNICRLDSHFVLWYSRWENFVSYPADTGRKLNVHKTFRRRPECLLNVLRTFNLRPVPTGYLISTQCLSLANQNKSFPMDTSLLIRHRFDVEIPRGKFVEITLILKGESTWKLWHRFNVDISTWNQLSKSTKYRWVLHVNFSMLFRRQINVTSVLAVSILSFSNIFRSGNLF